MLLERPQYVRLASALEALGMAAIVCEAVWDDELAADAPVMCTTESWPATALCIRTPAALAPPKRLTVALDLDETLVATYRVGQVPRRLARRPSVALACELGGAGGRTRMRMFPRPGLGAFLERARAFADLVVFTAGVPGYAEPLTDLLDPHRKLFSSRLYRPATVALGGHEFVKDLGCLGRDLARTVLVDNNPFSFAAQPRNGVPALPFLGDPADRHLMGAVLPLLEALAAAPDVRPLLEQRFHIADWLAAHGCTLAAGR